MKLTVNGNEARYSVGGNIVRLRSLSPGIVRCTVAPGGRFTDTSPLDILPLPAPGPGWAKGAEGEGSLLENGGLTLSLSPEGVIEWRREGRPLLREGGWVLAETPVIKYTTGGQPAVIRREVTVDGERNFIENLRPHTDRMALRARHHFHFAPEEAIHGLGQGEEGIYNYRGRTQYLYQHNMRIPVPFFLSTAGYGVLYDCGSLMTWNDGDWGSYVFLDTVDQLDYYFLQGDSADEIIARYRELTGRASLLPKWAFGYIQSKERYRTQDEVVETAAEYRRRGLPLDCVVQDWNTWADGCWGDKHVDRERYPDLPAMNKSLHDMQVHSMVSVWPNMNAGTPNHTEFSKAGWLLGDLATYDAFRPEARAMYWRQAREELFDGGFDSWWCDSTEPFSGPDWNGPVLREPWERYELVGGEHKRHLDPALCNLYAVAHARGMYEGQRAATEDKRVLNLTRSGSAGIQRYGSVLWSGDICARWDVLRSQITEGLNVSLSGLPWWTLDIGGFFTVRDKWQNRGCGMQDNPNPLWFWQGSFDEGVADQGYRELYVRWFQLGAFLPLFRAHGTDTPRELWQFGEPGNPYYDALEKALRLRYRLMPYLYSAAAAVTLDHSTLLRPLLFDFPGDKWAAACSDSFLFGPALLVCPVTAPMSFGPGGIPLEGEEARRCYLPATSDWYSFAGGERLAGGQEISVPAPLDTIPLFVRAGSIIPMERGLNYAAEAVDTPLEIRVYPGRDGRFLLYEDAGDGYGYELGEYSRIPLEWREADRVFTIGGCGQSFPGSLVGRQVTVSLQGGGTRQATYTGSPLEIDFNRP